MMQRQSTGDCTLLTSEDRDDDTVTTSYDGGWLSVSPRQRCSVFLPATQSRNSPVVGPSNQTSKHAHPFNNLTAHFSPSNAVDASRQLRTSHFTAALTSRFYTTLGSCETQPTLRSCNTLLELAQPTCSRYDQNPIKTFHSEPVLLPTSRRGEPAEQWFPHASQSSKNGFASWPVIQVTAPSAEYLKEKPPETLVQHGLLPEKVPYSSHCPVDNVTTPTTVTPFTPLPITPRPARLATTSSQELSPVAAARASNCPPAPLIRRLHPDLVQKTMSPQGFLLFPNFTTQAESFEPSTTPRSCFATERNEEEQYIFSPDPLRCDRLNSITPIKRNIRHNQRTANFDSSALYDQAPYQQTSYNSPTLSPSKCIITPPQNVVGAHHVPSVPRLNNFKQYSQPHFCIQRFHYDALPFPSFPTVPSCARACINPKLLSSAYHATPLGVTYYPRVFTRNRPVRNPTSLRCSCSSYNSCISNILPRCLTTTRRACPCLEQQQQPNKHLHTTRKQQPYFCCCVPW